MADPVRRNFIKAAGVAAFTTNIFTGKLKGANERVNTAFIGMGKQGRGNLSVAMRQEAVNVHSVCDVFDRNLKMAHETAIKKFPEAKAIKDFREVLADKSVDAIFIGTPDHWHAYMSVEACKAGKDVYVEKPVCVTVEEAKKMVDAARKYNRVVQAGTQQRSAEHFQKAVAAVKSGELGHVTAMKTWY
ncbi:MAG TPA: Gfo/Idh/MocA family oxidoreductase, partial [Bryobacteraceae bacterium]|nr:Gfo/Idh/MocA family oxidoreductase [Bryobacteraceae bacterium]